MEHCTYLDHSGAMLHFEKALPCLPNLSSCESWFSLGSLRLGKYTETIEIVIPELPEMRTAHIASIGTEALYELNPDLEDGKLARITYDSRTKLALFRSLTATDYIAAQCLRRRLMYYHMEIFKKVDIIVTPTTPMTARIISPTALRVGETNLRVSGNLMRFTLAGNLLAFPAISVPVGCDKQGLPIGIQRIGRPWCEASILRLAAAQLP